MRKLIVGNWKMHGSGESARLLVGGILEHQRKSPAKGSVVLCPPAVLLKEISRMVEGSSVALGGQDCHAQAEGAYTGDISARMLREAGCAYVIVGHSERRMFHGEHSKTVAAKAERAIAEGLAPIICVGESRAEREAGQAEAVVASQVAESVPPGADASQFVLAYEPVWAIGTGLTPTAADIHAMHAHILRLTGERSAVLYGGSVKAANASEILGIPGVGGALVGGASLKAEEFCAIIDAGNG